MHIEDLTRVIEEPIPTENEVIKKQAEEIEALNAQLEETLNYVLDLDTRITNIENK